MLSLPLPLPCDEWCSAALAVGKKDEAAKKDKEKKEKPAKEDDDDEPTSKKIRLVSPIAKPLADKKLTKKVLKTIKKASKGKQIKRGVKEVVKAIKKGEKVLCMPSTNRDHVYHLTFASHCILERASRGVRDALLFYTQGLAVIAGDISPIEVIAHVPILCEEMSMPYIYVPSKEDLGTASQTKRPTSIVMMSCKADSDFKEVSYLVPSILIGYSGSSPLLN